MPSASASHAWRTYRRIGDGQRAAAQSSEATSCRQKSMTDRECSGQCADVVTRTKCSLRSRAAARPLAEALDALGSAAVCSNSSLIATRAERAMERRDHDSHSASAEHALDEIPFGNHLARLDRGLWHPITLVQGSAVAAHAQDRAAGAVILGVQGAPVVDLTKSSARFWKAPTQRAGPVFASCCRRS